MKTTAVALGTFDGVHAGHRAVIDAAKMAGTVTALCFARPPKTYFSSEPLILTDTARKEELLHSAGANRVELMDFHAVKDLIPGDFVSFLCRRFRPNAVFCGSDYTFGAGGVGNAELLAHLLKAKGVSLAVVPTVCKDGFPVSSTRIRELIAAGKIEEANRLLCSPFSFAGEILHGDARGRTIGFPTVNQRYPDELCRPLFGVYGCTVMVDGKEVRGICNIGLRPTFKNNFVGSETHLFGVKEELYGKTARVFLTRFIRKEQKFASLDALQAAIRHDCEMAEQE